MVETDDITSALEQALPIIDRYLAEEDVPLAQRPTQAAIDFVINYVQAVREPNAEIEVPGKPDSFMGAPWFAKLYAKVDEWYRDRFGDAMTNKRDDRLTGAIAISGTVFAFRVPSIRRRPGQSDSTIWIGFPDGVREDERPLDWIEAPPNLDRLTGNDLRAAELDAELVANALRSIRAGLMGVAGDDRTLSGLKAGILPHLQRGAELLFTAGSDAVQRAYWELQLACESALKALQQQRTSTFKQTHDLFVLYDGIDPKPAFNRDLLKQLPRWEEVMDLRYGQGVREDRVECMKCYRAVLSVVTGTVQSMNKFGLGKAEFEIGRPPWMISL